jgi:hypothetical protein
VERQTKCLCLQRIRHFAGAAHDSRVGILDMLRKQVAAREDAIMMTFIRLVVSISATTLIATTQLSLTS